MWKIIALLAIGAGATLAVTGIQNTLSPDALGVLLGMLVVILGFCLLGTLAIFGMMVWHGVRQPPVYYHEPPPRQLSQQPTIIVVQHPQHQEIERR